MIFRSGSAIEDESEFCKLSRELEMRVSMRILKIYREYTLMRRTSWKARFLGVATTTEITRRARRPIQREERRRQERMCENQWESCVEKPLSWGPAPIPPPQFVRSTPLNIYTYYIRDSRNIYIHDNLIYTYIFFWIVSVPERPKIEISAGLVGRSYSTNSPFGFPAFHPRVIPPPRIFQFVIHSSYFNRDTIT